MLNEYPATVLAVWVLSAAGWGAVAGGLCRGLSGYTRRLALLAHVLTLPAVVLFPSILGFGFLYLSIAVAAEWWALILVTRGRPERLVLRGDLRRLAAWLALTAAATMITTSMIL
ncbi:hypothetical protein F8566_20600 [Actinomadura rudentiformis]|uniref:Uncharacterized protein n=1 Tax=Actinomadura rudentiformis TaxID=359158 RepID=A0A6H9YZW0_9ACTN|nr:hypothetical protein F8566_20600 [Actinomadura rudentiformis]